MRRDILTRAPESRGCKSADKWLWMRGLTIFVIIFFLTILSETFFAPSFAFAANNAKIVSKANKLYKDKKYDEALRLYTEALSRDSASAGINYDLGAAQFKKGNYQDAIASFEKSVSAADKALEAKAVYNIANSKYKIGKIKEKTDTEEAVKFLNESLDHYKRVMDIDPKDNDAKFNYEFVEKELKALSQRLKQRQQSQKEKKQGSASEKQEDQEKQEGQNKSQQKKEDEQKQGEGQNKPQSEESPAQEGKKEQSEREAREEKPEKEEERGEVRQEGGVHPEEKEPSGKAESAGQEENLKEMSQQEAKMLLEDYRQQEKAFGRINDTQRAHPAEVLEDW